MNGNVILYVLVADGSSEQAERTYSLFSDNLFQKNFVDLTPPDDLKADDKVSLKEKTEAYRFNWCLKEAREQYPNNYVVIVKDTSISNASPDQVADIISATMADKSWDVCYLSKWLDRCDLYSDKRPINGSMSSLVKTVSPNGTQALMFSPHGRDVVLGATPMKDGKLFPELTGSMGKNILDSISSGNLVATAVVPNLINFDLMAANKPEDYLKANECAVVMPGEKKLATASGMSGWFWLLLIILIILVVGGFLYLTRRGRW